MNPTVSIIVYYKENRGWLHEALTSIRQQRYDGKIELIMSHNPEYNASQNLNEGIRRATGDYIRYLSEDDLLPQFSIHQSIECFEQTGADFIHAKAVNFWGYPVIYPEGYISFSGRTEKQEPKLMYPDLSDLLKGNVIHGGTVMYKAELLKKFPFDETLTCAEEYDLNMLLLKRGYKLDYCNAFTYFYRRHDKQKSLGKGIDQIERAKRIDEIKQRYR